jgi:hypothetical protein
VFLVLGVGRHVSAESVVKHPDQHPMVLPLGTNETLDGVLPIGRLQEEVLFLTHQPAYHALTLVETVDDFSGDRLSSAVDGVDDFTNGTESWFSEELSIEARVFEDDFESGGTTSWSATVP